VPCLEFPGQLQQGGYPLDEAPSQENLVELLILFSWNEKHLTVEEVVPVVCSTWKQTKHKTDLTKQGEKQSLS
jgi:hypothetical protein